MKKLLTLSVLTLAATLAYSQPVHIEKKGSGKAILLLPGFTTPGSVWHETISNLDHPYETHIASYAGFNGLEPIGFPWYSPIKETLIQYVQKEKLTDLTVIGHSMGGNLAIELAAALPKTVTGLILVDAIPCMRELMMPGVPASSLQYDSPYNNQMLNMNQEAFESFTQTMAQNMTNDPQKANEIASWAIAADRKTYIYGYTDLLKTDMRADLSKIETPTLILGASFPNKETTQATFDKQYKNLPSKTILIADDSKHFIMYDQPTWFYTQVNDYLKRDVEQ
ncbi:MAG: alpha/beta hydrolase [Ekhidna sp.]|nr:alpha/beta hydrolase [Ekhidna sp.]